MFENCVLISFGSHVDSPLIARRLSLRSRYACLRKPLSNFASRHIRPELHSAKFSDAFMAIQPASCTSRRAHHSTPIARFSCRDQRNPWNAGRTLALAAQGLIARGMHVSSGSRRTEGLEDRPLPPQPSPSCLSRFYEEGNVDQRVATGGMPDRDC